MTTPYVAYSATSGQTDFTVPFPYINRTHVQVQKNGVLQALAPWPQDGIVRLLTPASGGEFIEVIRETPIDEALVVFQDGNILTSNDLNTAVLQTLYRQQEIVSLYERTLLAGKVRLADGTGTSADAVIDETLQLILEDTALADLRARYADIDANALALLNEVLARKAELQATADALAASVSSLSDDVDAKLDVVDTKLDAVDATIDTEINRVDGLLTVLRTDVDGNHAIVVSDISTLNSDVLAQATALTGLSVQLGAAEAAIVTEQQARASADEANASAITALDAQVEISEDIFSMNFLDDAYAVSGPTVNARALIVEERAVRVSNEALTAHTIDLLTVRVGDTEANILSEQTARINADGALATDLTALTVRVGTSEADILNEQTARVNADNAIVTDLTALTTRVGDAEADILSEQTARSNADSAIATDLTALTTRVGDAEADILSEQSARSNADSAIATDLSALTTRVGDAEADIVSEQSARSTADSAIASDVSALTTRVGDAEADIVSEQNARSSADSAIASDVTLLTTRVGDAEADILSEQSARVSGDNALASDVTGLLTRMGTAESDIVSEQSARSSADTAIASDLTALTTRVGTTEADILTEQTARSTADSALATDFSGLKVTQELSDSSLDLDFENDGYSVAGYSEAGAYRERLARIGDGAVIASELSAVETRVGENEASVATFATSISGLEAKYGVSLDVNGYVTGFAQHNNGTTGTFVVRADTFSVVSSDGSHLVSPFTVTASGVQINGNLVVSGSITSGQLAANSVTSGTAHDVSGSISCPGNTWTEVISKSFTSSGGDVRIDFSAVLEQLANSGAGNISYRIKRNGSVIKTALLSLFLGNVSFTVKDENQAVIGTGTVDLPQAGNVSIFYTDTAASAATHTWSVEINGLAQCNAEDRQIGILELKR